MTSQPNPSELYATADFCLIPMGLSDPSVAVYIAECQRVLEKTGLVYKMHGYGTNIEGPWSAVCQAIQACHAAIHAMGVPRIATDVRIGTRTDRVCVSGEVNKGKVIRVERILQETAK